ncbi:MAG: hypothetical protein AAF415_03465 [Pseudomonadota bacterium]
MSTLAGVWLGIWAGGTGRAWFAGIMTAWLGGGAMTLTLAYGWYRGIWLTGFVAQPVVLEDQPGEAPPDAEDDLWQWTADLMAEQFEADLAADRAAQEAAQIEAEERVAERLRRLG